MNDISSKYLLDLLHRNVGICTHCGKKDCAGKQSGSTLPLSLSTKDLIEAINLAIVEGEHGSAQI